MVIFKKAVDLFGPFLPCMLDRYWCCINLISLKQKLNLNYGNIEVVVQLQYHLVFT